MKARKIVEYSKMGSDLRALFSNMYYKGIENTITEIFDPQSKMKRKAVKLETNDCQYLVVLDQNIELNEDFYDDEKEHYSKKSRKGNNSFEDDDY